MHARILIIEDDSALREIMSDYFIANQYEVVCASDGYEALRKASSAVFEVILLDINLPDIDGFHVCSALRSELCITAPVLFITARISEEDKLNGYACGADDYITKPFSLPVLQAKITAMLKRRDQNAVKQYGGIIIDRNEHTVTVGQEKTDLAHKEFELLSFLAENEGGLFSRQQLLIRIWGYDFDGSDRVIDDHIRKLRKKLGQFRNYIRTVHGAGYCFRVPAERK